MRAGEFTLTFFRVSHSVPDSAAVLIEAGGRRILHSGDFKLDDDPPDGETTDREGIAAAVGDGRGPRARGLDQRRAAGPLRSRSAWPGAASRAAFAGAPGRIVLTTFSSHVARVSQAAQAGARARPPRRVPRAQHAHGRRDRRAVRPAARCRPASRPAAGGSRRAARPAGCSASTSGSQGEPFSALYRLALDEHADLKLSPGDLVLFSARTIPGHERSVNRVSRPPRAARRARRARGRAADPRLGARAPRRHRRLARVSCGRAP